MGAGAMGKILAHVIGGRAHINWWDTDASKIPSGIRLENIAPKANIILLCVPTFAVRPAIQMITPHLAKKALFVSVAKGLEPVTGFTVDLVMQEELKKTKSSYALLSGPMLAAEISEKMGFGILATKEAKDFVRLKKILSSNVLHIYHETDVHSVALAGVLKNIYAIAFGVACGLGWGDNARGALATLAVSEMASAINRLGGNDNMAMGFAGIGDLIATGLSSCSRNHQVGKALAGGDFSLKSEGTRALPFFVQHLKPTVRQFPVLYALVNILLKKQKPTAAFKNIF